MKTKIRLNHPIMRKGGVHEKSTKAKRRKDKVLVKVLGIEQL